MVESRFKITKTDRDLVKTIDISVEQTRTHMRDVYKLWLLLNDYAINKVKMHDHTKISYKEVLFNYIQAKLHPMHKKNHPWHKIHYAKETHHVLDYCGPETILLTDVIEMLVDWIAAGKARGKPNELIFTPNFVKKLKDATRNTYNWLDEHTD